MQLIVFSRPDFLHPNEVDDVISFFDNGLSLYHLRKPGASLHLLEEFIKKVPTKNRQHIILHHYPELVEKYKLGGFHHSREMMKKYDFYQLKKMSSSISKTCHSTEELKSDNNKHYDYVFVSPVFDSISKADYKSQFSLNELNQTLKNISTKVIALGGINSENVHQLTSMNFSGIATLGGIWSQGDPKNKFNNFIEALNPNP